MQLVMPDRRTCTQKTRVYKILDWYVIKDANYFGFTIQHRFGWVGGGREGGRGGAPLSSFKKDWESSLDNEQLYS